MVRVVVGGGGHRIVISTPGRNVRCSCRVHLYFVRNAFSFPCSDRRCGTKVLHVRRIMDLCD